MADWYCSYCELPSPGCCHVSGQYVECKAGPRTDPAWKIGKPIWENLADRRGIKQQLEACAPEIQEEIIQKIGELAIKAVKDLALTTI